MTSKFPFDLHELNFPAWESKTIIDDLFIYFDLPFNDLFITYPAIISNFTI